MSDDKSTVGGLHEDVGDCPEVEERRAEGETLSPQQTTAYEAVTGTSLGRAVAVLENELGIDSHEVKAVLDARNALAVLTLDVRIVKFLEENDPKALEQARAALS